MRVSINRPVDCPSDEVLSAYIKRALPENNREAISRHLFLCNTCLEYAKLLLWDSSYEQTAAELSPAQLNQPIGVTPVMAEVLERFKGFREHRRNFPAKTLREIGVDGVRVGQVWRTRVEDIVIPTIHEEGKASVTELNSDAHLVLITNSSVDARRVDGKTYHVMRVVPIDIDTDYAAEGDLVIDQDESPLGYSFMAQLWNEQGMLQENLDSYLGEFNEDSHPTIWKSLNRQGLRPLAPGAFSLENIIINGLFYDPVLRYRAREYEETQYLRAPVESLMEALSEVMSLGVNETARTRREPSLISKLSKYLSTRWRMPEFAFGRIAVAAAVIAMAVAVLSPFFIWRSMRSELISRDNQISVLEKQKRELEEQAYKGEIKAEVKGSLTEVPVAVPDGQEERRNKRDFLKLAETFSGFQENPASAGQIRRPRIASHVAINDAGGRIGLDNMGRLTGLENAPPPFQAVAKEALTGNVVVPEELRNRLRSDDGDTRTRGTSDGSDKGRSTLLYPVATSVRSNRPTFKWRPVSGAKYYVVRVFTNDFRPLVSSEPERLTQTEWTPTQPISSQAGYYRWQVDVIASVEKNPDEFKGKFVILDEARESELRQAEVQYPNSHLLLGTLYAKSGLFDEAEREFQMLLKDNPKSSLVKKLLRDVERSRRTARGPF